MISLVSKVSKTFFLSAFVVAGLYSGAEAQNICGPGIQVRETILLTAPGVRLENGSVHFPVALGNFNLEPKQLLGLSVTHLDTWKVMDGSESRQVVTATSLGDQNLRCAGYFDAVEGSTDDAGVTCSQVTYRHEGDRLALRVTYCAR